jgi:hypothetical protein
VTNNRSLTVPGSEELERFVRESNAIEGAPTDFSSPWVRQHLAAAYYVVGAALLEDVWPISILHEVLFNNLEEHAGQIRKVRVQVGQHICPEPEEVSGLVASWEKSLRLDLKDNRLNAELAWRYHDALECIHPFVDGNGRIGRLVLNGLRLLAGDEWITIHDADKQDYYELIRRFQDRDWPEVYKLWRQK